MYHIKEDKRQKETADRIRDALTKCLAVKSMSEISVSDLSRESGASRSSFYRSFDTPMDVLMYACDTRLDMLVNDYKGHVFKDREAFVLFSLNYWYRHSDLLEAFVHCDRLDIVQKALEASSSEFITQLIDELNSDFTPQELDYLRAGTVGLLINVLTVWIRHGKKETPEEIFSLYKHAKKLII